MMKSKYTIYAEYCSLGAMDRFASFFKDYDHTITTGLGAFNGVQEESMQMDIIMMEESDDDRALLMKNLKEFEVMFCERFNQECLLVTRSEVEIIDIHLITLPQTPKE
tara:strand:+ start:1218 stop:1541 length:324 start_codon:yes stop_codon:yes gene_type:complete